MGKRQRAMTTSPVARFETLEPRLLLAATPEGDISYIQETYHGTPAVYDFEMFYSDDVAINTATLDNNDVRVIGPGYDQTATFLGTHPIADPRYVRAVYRVNAPGGFWDYLDNGAYTFIMQSNQVADNVGSPVAYDVLDVTTVHIDYDPSDLDVDVSCVQDPYHGLPANLDFEVTYESEDYAINTTLLDNNDFLVVGPAGSRTATFLGIHPIVDPTKIKAVYRINPPGGTWDIADNGVYTLILQSSQVADANGNVFPAQALETTTVDLGGGSSDDVDVDVRYLQDPYHGTPADLEFEAVIKGDSAINTGTLDNGDFLVVGPNGYSQTATFVGFYPPADPTHIRAIYRVTPPGGAWDTGDNGFYTVVVQGGQIFDVTGSSAITEAVETFEVDIDRPDADLTCIAPTYDASWTPLAFEMRYWGDLAIDTTTIDSTDVRIIGPNGYDQLATLVGLHPVVDPTKVLAVYSVPAPVGGWNTNANGTYTVIMQANQVADVGGAFALSETLDTFDVDIDRPEAHLAYIQDAYHGTPTEWDFLMRYDADLGVDTSTLDSTDIVVTGPGGSQFATYLGPIPVADPRHVYAVYRIPAPGGGWNPTDNGTYTLNLQADQVFDLGGISALPKTLDTAEANIQAPDADVTYLAPTYDGSWTPLAFEMRYWGDMPVDTTTIDSLDVRITGPNGYDQFATLVGLHPVVDPTKVLVVYTVPAPAGGWNTNANGTYTLMMQTGQVADVSGSFAPAETLDTFVVDIDRPEMHMAYIAPTYQGTPANFDFLVRVDGDLAIDTTTLDNNDILVTGPGGSQLATFVGLIPVTDPKSVFAVYRVAAPGGGWDPSDSGTYTFALQSGQVFDVGGIDALAKTLDTADVDMSVPEGHMAYVQDPYRGNSATYDFLVRYEGDVAIDITTIGAGDVRVVGPNAYNSFATFVGLIPIVDPANVRAVYRVATPGGTWDVADNGDYSFLLEAGAVADTAGSVVVAKTLEVATVDIVAAEAKITYIPPTYDGTLPNLDLLVRYWGDRDIDLTTVGALDIRIVGPGYDAYATFVGLIPVTDPTKVFAVYRVEPPGGAWSSADNGTYTLLIETDRVFDVLGVGVTAETLDTVRVNI